MAVDFDPHSHAWKRDPCPKHRELEPESFESYLIRGRSRLELRLAA